MLVCCRFIQPPPPPHYPGSQPSHQYSQAFAHQYHQPGFPLHPHNGVPQYHIPNQGHHGAGATGQYHYAPGQGFTGPGSVAGSVATDQHDIPMQGNPGPGLVANAYQQYQHPLQSNTGLINTSQQSHVTLEVTQERKISPKLET